MRMMMRIRTTWATCPMGELGVESYLSFSPLPLAALAPLCTPTSLGTHRWTRMRRCPSLQDTGLRGVGPCGEFGPCGGSGYGGIITGIQGPRRDMGVGPTQGEPRGLQYMDPGLQAGPYAGGASFDNGAFNPVQSDPAWENVARGYYQGEAGSSHGGPSQQPDPGHQEPDPWASSNYQRPHDEDDKDEVEDSKTNVPWMTSPAPGGPDIPEFFRSWTAHISYFIYKGKDWEKMKEWSWGSCLLAHVFKQLGTSTRRECAKISMCFTLLQSWIYAHFPRFRPSENAHWDGEAPYCSRWMPETGKGDRRDYKAELQALRVMDVDWTPYGVLDYNDPEIKPSLYDGIICFGDITEPYMPDRFMRQFGRVQRIPHDIILATIAKRPVSAKGYRVQHALGLRAWNSQGTHQWALRDFGEDAVQGYEAVEEYMPWYVLRTHLFISSPGEEEYQRVINGCFRIVRQHVQPTRFDVPPEVQFALADMFKRMYPFAYPPHL